MPNRLDLSFVVAGDEVDLNGRLFLDKLIEKIQIANALSSNEIGLTDALFEEKNASWILLDNRIELYQELPKVGDEIIIETEPVGVKGIKFYRQDHIYLREKKEENLIAINGSVWIISDTDSHRPLRPHRVTSRDHLASLANPNKDFAKKIRSIKPFAKNLETLSVGSYQVGYSDLDLNIHLHNTHYIRMGIDAILRAYDFDPNEMTFHPQSLQIGFIREVLINETLTFHLAKQGAIYALEGRLQGEPSFIMKLEFMDTN